MTKFNLIIVSIFLSLSSFAQKKGKEKTIECQISYQEFSFKGTYVGTVSKVSKKLVPNGSGTFNGFKVGTGTNTVLLANDFNSSLELNGMAAKSSSFNVSTAPNDDFSLETSISMERLDENAGGAIIRLNLNGSSYEELVVKFSEYKKEPFDPATVGTLEKTAFVTARTAFNNIEVSGLIGKSTISSKMKAYALDYTKFNKLKISKKGNILEIFVNDNSQGTLTLPSEAGLSKVKLDKDNTHDVKYDFIYLNKTSYSNDDILSYSGNWIDGQFDGQGELSYNGGKITGVFTSGNISGNAKVEYNGYSYQGELINGIANGKGKIVTSNYEYSGEVSNWKPNGLGTMIIKDNSIKEGKTGKQFSVYPVFEGQFMNGNIEGTGKMKYCNGDSLIGHWVGSTFTGNGKLTLGDGSIYIGEWKNGNKDGKGKLIYPDGSFIDGEFINNAFNGSGKIKLEDGGTFEGPIVMGKPSGNGTVTYTNGDKLTGQWNEYGFTGTGKRTYEQIPNTEDYCYEEGVWKNGKLNGKGTKVYQFKVQPDYEWLTVATYTGDFVDGQFNGKGKLEYYDGFQNLNVNATWSNGQSISGKVIYTIWDEDSKTETFYDGALKGLGIAEGFGTFKDWDGSVYVGQVKNGLPNGQGTRTLSNNQVEKGNFVDGEFKKPYACKTATIGNQVWMAENLTVTKFRNGDDIPRAKTEEEWFWAYKNRTPMYCYVENDPATKGKNGILYNCWAVNDSRGLAPDGWRIPIISDIKELDKFINSDLIRMQENLINQEREGWNTDKLANDIDSKYYTNKTNPNLGINKLKSTNGWDVVYMGSKKPLRCNGTNQLKFNAIPSLYYYVQYQEYNNFYYSKFQQTDEARFWTLSKNDLNSPYIFSIKAEASPRFINKDDSFQRLLESRGILIREEVGNSGLPIRCIKE